MLTLKLILAIVAFLGVLNHETLCNEKVDQQETVLPYGGPESQTQLYESDAGRYPPVMGCPASTPCRATDQAH